MCLKEGSAAGMKGAKPEVFIYPLKRLPETRDENQSELVVAVGISVPNRPVRPSSGEDGTDYGS